MEGQTDKRAGRARARAFFFFPAPRLSLSLPMAPPSTRASPVRGRADEPAPVPAPPPTKEEEAPPPPSPPKTQPAADHRRRSNPRLTFFLTAAAAAWAAWALGGGWAWRGWGRSGGGAGGSPPRAHTPIRTRSILNTSFPRAGPVSPAEAAASAAEAAALFGTAFDAYLAHAFPRDELRPLSCRGRDSQGGVALTLIDALSTALTMGDAARLGAGLAAAASTVPDPDTGALRPALCFDRDARVHVFELTIRALGGLLSVHAALTRPASPARAALPAGTPDPAFLLAAAVDLGDRLLPAYATPTGLPLSWVNLRTGPVPGDIRATCTACAGTAFLARFAESVDFPVRELLVVQDGAGDARVTLGVERLAARLAGSAAQGRFIRRVRHVVNARHTGCAEAWNAG